MLSSHESEPDQQPGDAPAEELAQLESRYRRALADLDNYRKRTARDTEQRVQDARVSVIGDWLDVVDSVERALALDPQGACDADLSALLEQMRSVLAREGATRIGAVGETFDPYLHEAVETRMAGDLPDRTIVAVQRSGYALGDRLIRPAQVVVARTG